MKAINRKRRALQRRHRRLRRRVVGTEAQPRLCVSRSLAHTYAQIVDDATGKTLVTANTRQAAVRGDAGSGGNIEAAKAVGREVAVRALACGVKRVCFDRGGRKYHGRVKALAEAAREAGLQF